MKGQHLAIVLLSLAAASGATGAKEIYERSWVEVRSPHFTMTSRLSAEESIAIVRDLEMLREAAQIMTSRRAAEHVPTHVVFLGDHYPDLKLDQDARQVVIWGPRETSLVVGKLDPKYMDELYDQYLQRYTAFLLRGRQEPDLPTWYNQGTQWLVASARVKEGRVGLGWPADLMLRRLQQAQWIDARELVTRASGGDPSVCSEKCEDDWRWLFQAQSWLLVHMLVVGSGAGAGFDATMDRYLELRKGGLAVEPAFVQAFGVEPRELDPKLHRYAGRPLKLVWLDAQSVEPSVRALSPPEVATRLARLAQMLGKTKAAENLLEAALALDARSAPGMAALAGIRASQGRGDEAVRLYEQAIELEPAVTAHRLDYAWHLIHQAGSDDGSAGTRAREQLRKCAEVSPHDPAVLTAYAYAFSDEGGPLGSSLAALEEANALVPYASGVQLPLAKLYAAQGRLDDATRLLRLHFFWAYEDRRQPAAEARALMSELEQRNPAPLENGAPAAN